MAEKTKRELNEYVDVGHSELENHLRTQNAQLQNVAEDADASRKLTDFLWLNIFGFAYHYLKSRFGPRHAYQYYPVGEETGVFKMPLENETTQIALLSDWASDTPESDKIGAIVAAHKPDFSIHLGDIYFVGAPSEVHDNFISPKASWPRGKRGSLALSGNHEMYSNGDAFFKTLLPTMGIRQGDRVSTQKAGFFCLENDYWRIIGLDTGYTSVERPLIEILSPPDCHLRKEQLSWLKNQVHLENPNDRRGIIFLSHHPPFSLFRKAFPKPAQQLSQLFGGFLRPVLWIWGHEHRLVGYRETQVAKLPIHGRCIGHGGMPVEINSPKIDTDSIVFYDQRKRKSLRRVDVGYNGFAWLKFTNEKLEIEYRDIEDKIVVTESWEVDIKTGILKKVL
ncbi:metallophosphoesterase [Runella sp. MFBS21]|uniref:metallophosphoesterase family protein n=1 Tax=Runella sp. MFBS21 TaxID=3034018 RepID=UPI0023FA4728|nr:metallophosphoesterase [Runella sp. MFBS21]MDF7822228.1 metallophosphoesterase [Runella sp. MFBS21]